MPFVRSATFIVVEIDEKNTMLYRFLQRNLAREGKLSMSSVVINLLVEILWDCTTPRDILPAAPKRRPPKNEILRLSDRFFFRDRQRGTRQDLTLVTDCSFPSGGSEALLRFSL